MPDDSDLERERALAELHAAWRRFVERVDAVPADRWDEPGVSGAWSLRLVLGHVAHWDGYERDRLDGAAGDGEIDWEAINDRVAAQTAGRPFDELRAELAVVHEELIARLRLAERLDLEALREDTTEHYDEHAAEIDWWLARTATSETRSYGEPSPVADILPALDAGWEDWLLAIDEVPESAREVKGISGGWSLKDLIGHVAFWDAQLVDDLVGYAAGRPPIALDVDGWNAKQAERTRKVPLDQLLADMHSTHGRMLALLTTFEQVDPNMVAVDTWEHYGDHARDVRAWLSATVG